MGDGCDELLAGYHGEVFVRSSKESFSAFGPKRWLNREAEPISLRFASDDGAAGTST